MVIEGLKFQILAYGALTRAHNIIFPKKLIPSEAYFTNKMCLFSV